MSGSMLWPRAQLGSPHRPGGEPIRESAAEIAALPAYGWQCGLRDLLDLSAAGVARRVGQQARWCAGRVAAAPNLARRTPQ